MFKIGFYNYYEVLNKDNNMFENIGSATIKDFLKQMYELKQFASTKGFIVGTVNIFNINEIDLFVFIDMPDINNKYLDFAIKNNKPMYLIVWESKIVNSNNYESKYTNLFNKVFTYDDDYIDNNRILKLPYTFDFPERIPRDFENRKLCTMIAGNKYSEHPLELYSLRRDIIRWFEINHFNDFEFYGKDWDKYVFKGSIFMRVLNKIKPLKRLFKLDYKSYRGEIESKEIVFQKYRFAICFENAVDIAGYITEKLFDCFFSGCIPIYLGAKNIEAYIPSDCFINYRNFDSLESIYGYKIGRAHV